MTTRKIAFVSCAYGTHRPIQPAWKDILAAKPDLLLMLGDNAYMNWYEADWDLGALEACYRAQFEVKEFRAVVDSVPTLAVWDDHDCGPNDTCGAEVPAEKLAASRALFDHWMGFAVNLNWPHMYGAYTQFPEVQVIMLDGRSYRTHSAPPSVAAQPTLLGDVQTQWLWDRLDPAVTPQQRVTIVASGSAFSEGAPGHRVSDYQPFANELAARLAFRAGGDGDVGRRALFLGGDVHYNRFRTNPHGFHEAISSGVACFKTDTADYDEFTPDRFADNWGLITLEEARVRIDFHANAHTKGNPRSRTIDMDTWAALPPG